jgi:hypothetical protein
MTSSRRDISERSFEEEDAAVASYWKRKKQLREGTTLGNALEAFDAAPGQLFLRRREWPEGLVLEPAITTPGADVLRNVLGPRRYVDTGKVALWDGEASPYHLTLQDFFAIDWIVVDR